MKIGFTEKGDGGLDLSWRKRLNEVDGAVIITKNVTSKKFQEDLISAYKEGYKLILHAGCTGWGGSVVEPNVPVPSKQIAAIKELISKGFPEKNIVLRIDPIIPTEPGLKAVEHVLNLAKENDIIPSARVRVSIYDEYPHARERLKKAGFMPFYPDGRFYAPDNMFQNAVNTLEKFKDDIPCIYTCAETLQKWSKLPDFFRSEGCISKIDLDIMGLPMPENVGHNIQNRNGCKCLAVKYELLKNRKQCPHKCIYCYWKDK